MSVFKQDGGSNKEWGEISTFGRTWLFVTEEIAVNTISLPFDNLQLRMFEEGEADNTGEVQLTFETLECVAAQVSDLSGDIVATSEELTGVWAGSIVGVTGDVTLDFVEPIISMQAGLGVSCTFEPLEIDLQEAVNMADMIGSFKEPGLLSYGEYSFVSMDLKMQELELKLTPGVSMLLALENHNCDMAGQSGIVAAIEASSLRMRASLVGGLPPYIEAEMIEPVFDSVGSSQQGSTMNLIFKRMDIDLTGEVPWTAILSQRFRLLSASLTGTVLPVGKISGELLALRMSSEGIQSISANIDGRISLLKMLAAANIDGPNSLDLEFNEYSVAFTDDGGDCALADTLSFGG